MLTTTSAYKTAIAASSRTTRITGTLTLADTTEIAITNADIVDGSLYLKEQCVSGENIDTGNVYASEMGLGFITPTVDPYAFDGAILDLDFGVLRDGPVINAITNPGGFTVTTGWIAYAGVLSVSGENLIATGTDASSYNIVYQTTSITCALNKKVYVRVKFRVTNDVCLSLQLQFIGATTNGTIQTTTQASPVNGAWYTLSGVITIPADMAGSLQILIIQAYADAATNNGKVMEIDGTVGITCIDLTTYFGAGLEPTAAQCDIDFPTWFDGLSYSPYVPQVYEDVPLGVFYVSDPVRRSYFTELTAYDSNVLLAIPKGATLATGTPFHLIDAACTTAGVTLATLEAAINALPNGAMTLIVPANGSILTCRDQIMWVCQALSCFGRFDRAGALEIVPMHSASVRTIPAAQRYTPLTISDAIVKVTTVTMQILDVLYTSGTLGMTLALVSNPLFESQTTAAIQAAIDAIQVDITQAEYSPFDCPYIGDPSLQAGDYITLSETQSLLLTDPVGLLTHSEWHYRGRHQLRSVGQLVQGLTQVDQAISALRKDAMFGSVNAGRMTTGTFLVGTPGGERLEMIPNAGSVITGYNAANAKRVEYKNDKILFYDALGATAETISISTADATITVGAGKDFATIQAAINSLPKIINHTIYMNVYTGTYNEEVLLDGFSGSGLLIIKEVAGESASTKNFYVKRCALSINIFDFTLTNVVGDGVTVQKSDWVYLSGLTIIAAAGGYDGIYYSASKGIIYGGTISNRRRAIQISSGVVSVTFVAGVDNLVGIFSAGITQDAGYNTLTGTTPRYVEGGGCILPPTGINGNTVDSWNVTNNLDVGGLIRQNGNLIALLSYPVGAIYISVVSTSPATLFGGTWAAFGTGRVLVGIDTADANFNTIEKTGGEPSHTLTTPEIPSHFHQLNFGVGGVTGGVDVGAGTTSASETTQPTGGDDPHNNLQPYITVYMWKRTA